jgi:anti-anti-sigma factor
MTQPDSDSMVSYESFEVRTRTHRRTALLELFGELDIATVSQVADAFDRILVDPDGLRHVVVDLRGLTFMDARGISELVRRANDAHQNQHNLAVVRGCAAISRLMEITAVDKLLVLVESLEDLLPPASASTQL